MSVTLKQQHIRSGLFFAEVHKFLQRELSDAGYASVQGADLVVRVREPVKALGHNGRRTFEISSLIEKKFSLPQDSVKILIGEIPNEGLSATVQAEAVRFNLSQGIPVRRAAHKALRDIMKAGAKGAEVIVSGKLRVQRAKVMKFSDGYMIKAGHPSETFSDTATRHLKMRQGALGIRVRIMKPFDRSGSSVLPDQVVVHEPKVADE